MDENTLDLTERVARLEAEVARLAARLEAPRAPAALPVPPFVQSPRKPAGAPKRALNPVVLVAALGAVIFLAGAAFFLHLAVQMGWVGPELRFVAGLLVGGALGFVGGRQFFRDAAALGTCLLVAGLGTLVFTLYAGAFKFHFYAPPLGLLGAAMITLVAGGLAARVRHGAALCAALAVGLASPLVFSEGGHHELSLALYLAVLQGAALAVPYAARTGARWTGARWLALAGTWALLAAAAQEVPGADAGSFAALLVVHYALAALWIWLPGQGEPNPSTPTLLWFSVTLAMTALLWGSWEKLSLLREAFAAPVLGLALVNLLLVKPVRARLGSRQGDLGLLVLAGAHLALAVPVALDWAWVGPLWGLYALGLAWAAGYAGADERWEAGEVKALTLLAAGAAALASCRWAVDLAGFSGGAARPPVVNAVFAEGTLTALAWGLLARQGGDVARQGGNLARSAFVGMQIVGNLVAAMEVGRLVAYAGFGARAGDIARTLVLAASGALQWLYSLKAPGARGMAVAGYALLGVASLKLLVQDLDQASTPLRALVFLAVGAIFLGAALVGNKVRSNGGEGL